MRYFSYFENVRAQRGEVCTHEMYLLKANSKELLDLCEAIAAEEDKERRSELKKKLPVITWQACFSGRRENKSAFPSGLFMLDIDHVEDPYALYSEKVASRIKELGIVYVGKTASCHGLRIVAKCLPTLHTLEECQRWLASNLKIEFDDVCKDFARCSFMVHDSYTYYMNAGAIWEEDPEPGTVYSIDVTPVQVKVEKGESEKEVEQYEDQRESLFGGPTDYKGVPYETIAKEWLEYTGGEPSKGERNIRLYKLALRLRYIADFNEATLLRVMPRYGLPESEMKELIHSACGARHGMDFPVDLQEVLDRVDKRIKLGEQYDEEEPLEIGEISTTTEKVPPLPPVFRQWYDVAPEDFKTAVTLCQLPILGTLGSRLRARYLDGDLHSPSFQVSLEAPQASGKSFLVRVIEYELRQLMESDEAQRELEKTYQDKVSEMKMLNIKINVDNKDQILGTKPKGIIRYVPATMSITKMLMRMEGAQGLHLFAFAPEIDTVYKAFKRNFSSLSDALRISFENGLYGQDYASDQSYSGIVPLYYNCLFSGTPKAMCRFYPDVEDGLVSRVLFVSLPDQFGKPMPVWRTFTEEEKRIVDIGLARLNEITLQGSEVQPEYIMKMDWLNKAIQAWIVAQQQEAVREDNRTRDIFCRRSAVVGFRAGMLAWFLYGEKNTPPIRRNVCRFAEWVANCMLNQHLLRFNIATTHSNVFHWEDVYKELGDEFTREDLQKALNRHDVNSPLKTVIYKWRLLGVIETTDTGRSGEKNKITNVKFKKIKK